MSAEPTQPFDSVHLLGDKLTQMPSGEDHVLWRATGEGHWHLYLILAAGTKASFVRTLDKYETHFLEAGINAGTVLATTLTKGLLEGQKLTTLFLNAQELQALHNGSISYEEIVYAAHGLQADTERVFTVTVAYPEGAPHQDLSLIRGQKAPVVESMVINCMSTSNA